MITWGLSCRTLAGDSNALETLRAFGKMDPQAINPPDEKLFRDDPTTFKAAQRAYTDYTASLEERSHALLCLALLKEPGILPRAIERLTAKTEKAQAGIYSMRGFGAGTNALIEASIVAEPQEGWKKLVQILNQEGDAVSFEVKVSMFQCIMMLRPKPAILGGAPKGQFTLEAEISALLPKDAGEQMIKSYPTLLKSWKPKESAAFDNSMNTLVKLAYNLPKLREDSEVLTALADVKGKLADDPNAQHLKQMIDQVLAQLKAKTIASPNNAGAAKPQKPPDDF